MKIITGATDSPHITSNNDGEFNQGIWGDGLVVLANGSRLGYEIVSSTNIRIKDGDLVFQGRHALIEPGSYDNVNIETGQSGYNRIDLIVVHYEVDTNGYESISLRVIRGTATTGTPSAPSYTMGTIRTGSLVAESPLYEVTLTGVNLSLRMIPQVSDPLLSAVNSKQPIINGAVSSVVSTNLDSNKIVTTNSSGKLSASSTSANKLGYLANVNADIQSQIDSKQQTITGSISSVLTADLTPSRIIITDDSGKLAASSISSAMLNYISDITGESIQEQLDKKDLEKGSTFATGRVVATDDDHRLITTNVTATEINQLQGVTGNIQTQIDQRLEVGSIQPNKVLATDDNQKAKTLNVSSDDLATLANFHLKQKTIATAIDEKQDKIGSNSAISNVLSNNLTKERALISNANGKIAVSGVTKEDLDYIAGIQNGKGNLNKLINTKADKSGWTAQRVMMSNASGNLVASTITTTELAKLSGLTANVQTGLDNRVAKSKVVGDHNNTTSTGTGTVVTESGKIKSLGSFTLSAGIYQVNVVVEWDDAYKTGQRSIHVSTSATGSRISVSQSSRIAASPTGNTIQVLPTVLKPTTQTTYYVVGYQDCGHNLTVANIRYSIIGVAS